MLYQSCLEKVGGCSSWSLVDPHQQLLLEEVIWMLSQPLTMRYSSLVILLQLSIIHASSHSRVSRSTLNNHFVDDHCEGHFQVESSMIIRTEDSISLGAVFLNETQVKTSKINFKDNLSMLLLLIRLENWGKRLPPADHIF